MSKELTESIFKWIEILRNRPRMLIAADIIDYSCLRIYVEGYIEGISVVSRKKVGKEITKWYQNKIDMETSYYWASHIPFHFNGKSDEELKSILLNITEEFFRENPDWYK